jgi:ComEC/Rec2-related protein
MSRIAAIWSRRIGHPLVPIALLYTAGILLGHLMPVPPLLWLFIGCILALASWFIPQKHPWSLIALLVLAGWTNLVFRTQPLSPNDLRLLFKGQPELVTLRGVLAETPSERLQERRGREYSRTLAMVDVTQVERNGSAVWEPADGRVIVSMPGTLPARYYQGRGVEISGMIDWPKSAAAEGLFDYREYLYWQGIHFAVRASGTNDWRLAGSDPGAPTVSDRFAQWAHGILARGLPGEDESLRLIWALALGWKTGLTNEVSESFMRTGTMHIFAISGLHMVLIAGIMVSVLRVIRIPRGVCGWVVIPAIWFYTGVTGWQSSAIRSTVMMTVILVGWALRRPGNLLNSLAAAGFFLLLWDPRQLFQASFQLSFFVVLTLALLSPVFTELREQIHQVDPSSPDPLLPAKLRPRWQHYWEVVKNWFMASLSTSAAAWVGSMPIIAWYFHMITPVNLLANLVIIPLSSLALMCHMGSLVCGPWCDWACVLFNHSGWFFMTAMVALSDWMAQWPLAFLYVRPPGLVYFLVYYGILFGLLVWFGPPSTWRRWAMAAAIFGALLVLLPLSNLRLHPRLTVLAVQGGDAIFLDTLFGANDVLIDAGNEETAEFLVKPFLGAHGVNRLPACVLTHGDIAHVGGFPVINETFKPRQFLTGALPFRSPVYRRELKAWQNKVHSTSPGTRHGPWTVLHPNAGDSFSLADDKALVLRGEMEGVRVLLLSDLGKLGQRKLLERESDLRADIVVAGCPSNGEPLQDALLAAIRPRLILLSDAGARSSNAQKKQLLDRLSKSGAQVKTTETSGSITLEFTRGQWTLKEFGRAE